MGARERLFLAGWAASCLGACHLIDPNNLDDSAGDGGGADHSVPTDGSGADLTTDGSGADHPVPPDGAAPDQSVRIDAPGPADALGAPEGLAPGDASDASDASAPSDAPSCDGNVGSDPNNCGRCGRSCGDAQCSAGECANVQALALGPDHLAQANGVLYYTVGTAVDSYALDGGVHRSLATAPSPVDALAIGGPYAFWATDDGTIQRVNIASGSVTTLATGAAVGTACLGTNSTSVFWIASNGDVVGAALDAGPDAYTITVPDAGASVSSPSPCVAASDSFVVYPCTAGLGNTYACLSEFGGNSTVLSGPSGPGVSLVAVGDPSEYYFTAGLPGAVSVYHVAVGGNSMKIADVPADVTQIVADSQGIYWGINENNGGAAGCNDPLCTTGVVKSQLAYQVQTLALDSQWVYFADGSNPNTYRMPR
jgi:hypothetical protein